MQEYFVGIFVFIACIFLGAWMVWNSQTYQTGQYSLEIIEACEASLPRDENCLLQAVTKEAETKVINNG